MQYNLKDLTLMNMKKVRVIASNPRLRGGMHVFEIEQDMSEEEKLAFIDEMRDGVGTYMLELLQKWESEKDDLPKDTFGRPKTVSKKAWLKRNDTRNIFSQYSLGDYWLFGTEFNNMTLTCPKAGYNYDMEHTGKPVVHQWFHDLLKELEKEERKHFKETDSTQIKLTKVIERGQRYHIYFEDDLLHDIIWNGATDVTEAQLDVYLEAYETLAKHIEDISKTVKLLKERV